MHEQGSSQFLKNCIFTALMILMQQKDYDSITITDIAKKAGVSRMSYYRTYSSKEDILIQYFNDLFAACLEDFNRAPDLSEEAFDLKFFQTFLENKTLIDNLLHANLYNMVLEYFVKYLKDLLETVYHLDTSDPVVDYMVCSKAGSLCVVAVRWIENGARETPQEMAALFQQLKPKDMPQALIE